MLTRSVRLLLLSLLVGMILWRPPLQDAATLWAGAEDDTPFSTVPPPRNNLAYLPVVIVPPQGIALVAGADHTCALTGAGGVKCWGSNDYGQLGDGTVEMRTTPVDVVGLRRGVRAIAAGASHTCALTTAGSVKCWGDNISGQLGDGGGGVPCGVDDSLQCRLTPVNVAGLTGQVRAIASGDFHTCALTTDGGVKCWGSSGSGQLGVGTRTTGLTPVDVAGLSRDVRAIAAGGRHTCAVTGDGVMCWGGNWRGQLGNNTTEEQLIPVHVIGMKAGVRMLSGGTVHTCALTSTRAVKCWGANHSGQLGTDTTDEALVPVGVVGLPSAATVVTGGHHTCAVAGTQVMCWGGNWRGQLGDGTSENRLAPIKVVGLSGSVRTIAAGYSHTCAMKSNGRIACWGDNDYGQLGDGSTEQRLTPINVVWP